MGTGPDARGACLSPPGDVNGDGGANVTDALCVVLSSLVTLSTGAIGASPTCLGLAPLEVADLNCDGDVDVSDATVAVKLALGSPLGVLDANSNACADACESACGDGLCQAQETIESCFADCMPSAPNCCVSHPGKGCFDPAVESKVCKADPYCCATKWDVQCALEAEFFAQACAGSCCAAHAGEGCDGFLCEKCVCQADPWCCYVSWDADCSGCANTPPSSGAACACANACGCP
jgi:hypothetical protein